MIASHHSELDAATLGVADAAPTACTRRLRRDVHRTGPPAAIRRRAMARSLDAVMATFETSRLPNPRQAVCTSERHEARSHVNAKQSLGSHRLTGCFDNPVDQQRRTGRVIDTTAQMQRGRPGARQIAEAVPTLRLELIAASIRAEAAAKPTGDTE
ncbi:hypothetical protein BJ122_10639 [Rhodopseudomonas faecalis]|uniref:Uncharacterized protein n=1 Tax=Rhodopseudomonas faecalis TaxID=99655 RepID=A0A318TK76_9BRAD|nr:hypothetical protein [Rhodopseudomonas faecalis]PYF03548.1 hypothetical protein BJ122_10639 [Rhodopseudomonas faecalis]